MALQCVKRYKDEQRVTGLISSPRRQALFAWASVNVRGCHSEMEQEYEDRKSSAQQINHVDNDERSDTPWRKIQSEFDCLQEHQLRCDQDVVRHHAEVSESRDSECFHD